MKIKSRLSKVKHSIIKHHNTTVLSMALSMSTPEEWEEHQNACFEKAKKASDLVAIVMRMAFAYLCFLFFQASSKKSEFWYAEYAFNACSLFSIAIYFVILLNIQRIVIAHFAKDTAYHKNKLSKVIILFISLFSTFAVGYGISVLARSFAQASNLIHVGT